MNSNKASPSEQPNSLNLDASISKFVPVAKARSCVVCRSRKVRCDKTNPCSNCRKANIACVYPANDRPPKWARRLERITKEAESNAVATQPEQRNVEQVMQRLRSLEGLVKELSGQLEQANSISASTRGSSAIPSPGSSSNSHDAVGKARPEATDLQQGFGRLVVQDRNRSRYLSSGFWSRMNDELDGLKMATEGINSVDSDSSEEEESSSGTRTAVTQEIGRTPSDRHSFFFRHNLGSSSLDIRECHPLPSQIPFLLETFSENVNFIIGIVHMPTIRKIVKGMRGGDTSSLSAPNEALLFSIYYAAITSMEDDDVINNFGTTKAELNLKYRIGLEHSLAKADFLNVPDMVLVQSFAIFLCLARRYDSPRFVWMMTGLLIRMAQSLGLQRDGSNFDNLSPYEIEMRRRLWWVICLLDIRSSEDQGTELTITRDSFDTRLPSNVADADLDCDSMQIPPIQTGVTEVSGSLATHDLCYMTREMMAPGGRDPPLTPEMQGELIDKFVDKLDRGSLGLMKDHYHPAYWMAHVAVRLMMAKSRLLIYLPVLYGVLGESSSDQLRDRLLICAIEVAEYNHALNSSSTARQWRWIYQVYTHWYSIVYMLVEVARRPLLPTVERAWVALQSVWLIPNQSRLDRNNKHWIPLRKLMARARAHREAELLRLRGNIKAIAELEMEDRNTASPSSSGPFPDGDSSRLFLEHWRNLLLMQPTSDSITPAGESIATDSGGSDMLNAPRLAAPQFSTGVPQYPMPSDPVQTNSQHSALIPTDWMMGQDLSPGSMPWIWTETEAPIGDLADLEMNMDFGGDMDWQNWLDAAKDLA